MTDAARKPVSAFDRLLQLPAIFRGVDAGIRFGWSAKTVAQYMYLWGKKDYVAPLGGHSDVFANLVVDRSPDWDKALLMAMPSSVLIGLDVLRNAGWSTQMEQARSVAVREGWTYSTERFTIHPRNDEWFAAVRRVLDRSEGLPMLPPAWALADMLSTKGWGDCGLQPDDIDWSEISNSDRKDWQKACAALQVELGELDEDEQFLMAQAKKFI